MAKRKRSTASRSGFINQAVKAGRTALKNVQDSQLGEPVTLFGGRQANKAAALIGLTNDWADHYSMAAMYLRLNGMLPPTAKKEPSAEKK